MTEDAQLLFDYARKGDVASFSALVVRHSKWLTAYLRSMSPTLADAEDAVQETWIRVIRACNSYRGGAVRAYLTQIARSVAIDRFRLAKCQTVSVDAVGEDGLALSDVLPDASPTPDEMFECRATADEVRRAVRELPEGQREVLMMRIEAELSFREIAETMGIPLGTALTWMHAAKLRLKKELEKWK